MRSPVNDAGVNVVVGIAPAQASDLPLCEHRESTELSSTVLSLFPFLFSTHFSLSVSYTSSSAFDRSRFFPFIVFSVNFVRPGAALISRLVHYSHLKRNEPLCHTALRLSFNKSNVASKFGRSKINVTDEAWEKNALFRGNLF